MRSIFYTVFFLILLFLTCCITQFTPETNESQELIVVEGLITDQSRPDTIKLSKSLALNKIRGRSPLKGCSVYITDDDGNTYNLTELNGGIYITDPGSFRGTTGDKYTLHFRTNNSTSTHYSYESLPVEMKPVPSIDSLYIEKVMISGPEENTGPVEGCRIYLDTHDPGNLCKFYRWDYTETWEFIIPYYVPNRICWITDRSEAINIKNTSVLAEDRINRYPLKYISNETDRLSRKYSILVNQYSLTEEEYHYWEKLKNVTEDVGSLYDITPSTIQGNINCIEDPSEKVLGYFSVSSVRSKRIFINESFKGLVNLYTECVSDTIFGNKEVPYLNVLYWVIEDNPFARPPYKVITMHKGCADCTVRGSATEPSFWKEEK